MAYIVGTIGIIFMSLFIYACLKQGGDDNE